MAPRKVKGRGPGDKPFYTDQEHICFFWDFTYRMGFLKRIIHREPENVPICFKISLWRVLNKFTVFVPMKTRMNTPQFTYLMVWWLHA